MPTSDEEVAAERGDVDWHVRDTLARVEHQLGAHGVRELRDPPDGAHTAEHIRDVSNGDQFGLER